MKKIIAKFMASLFMFSAAVPSMVVATATSSPPSPSAISEEGYAGIEPSLLQPGPGLIGQHFIVDLEHGLVPGIETQTPVFLTATAANPLPSNMALMQFNTDNMLSHGWRVEYVLHNDLDPQLRRVVLEFERINQHMYIKHHVVDHSTGIALTLNPTLFNVHSHLAGDFLTIENYLSGNHAPGFLQRDPDNLTNIVVAGNPGQVVLNHRDFVEIPGVAPAIPEELTPPHFRITQGHGFTFYFGSQPINVLWQDDVVTIASQDFTIGRFHEVNFYAGPIGSVGFHSQRNLVTGLVGITGTPFANYNSTDITSRRRTASFYDRIDRRYDSTGSLVSTAHPTWPADPSEVSGLTLSFDLPLNYLGNVPSLSSPVVAAANLSPYPVNPNNVVSIIINDIFGTPTATSSFLIDPPEVRSEVTGGITRHIVDIHIQGLDTGMIFHDVSNISLQLPNTADRSRNTRIPWTSLFTFPEFEIRIVNGLPFVAITPFGMAGHYMLRHEPYNPGSIWHENQNPRDHAGESGAGSGLSSLVFSPVGENIVLLPISNAILTAVDGMFLQVFFAPAPGNFPVNSDGEPILPSLGYVYSQKLLYITPPIDINVRPPGFINVVDYIHTPANLERDRGLLEMSMLLDAGSTFIMDALFAQDAVYNSVDNRYEIVVYYEMRNALSPYPGESLTHFATLRATFFSDDNVAPEYVVFELMSTSDDTVTLINEGNIQALGVVNFEGVTRYTVSFNLEIDTIHRLSPTSPDYPFNFPNIYFLNITPVYDGVPVSPSIFASITLDEFDRTMVPPPQAFRVTPGSHVSNDTPGEEQSSFDIEFVLPAASILEYLQSSYGLDPIEASIYINLYVTVDEVFMRETFVASDSEETQNSQSAIFNRHQVNRFTQVLNALSNPLIQPTPDEDVETLFFSSLRGYPAMPGTPLNALRDENLVAIRRIPLYADQLLSIVSGTSTNTILFRYRLDGLDFNTQYFLTADIEVHQFDEDDFALKAVSHFAPVIAVTTPSPIEIPIGIDQDPHAPSPLNSRDVFLDSATIYFDRVIMPGELPDDYTETIEYEFIRIRGNQMDSGMLNDRRGMAALWQDLLPEHGPTPSGLTAFRTYNSQGANSAMQSFNGSSWANASGISGEFTASAVAVTDDTLEANTIYFYYVRTVREITRANGQVIRRYSVFNHITVTTTIVDSPRNLIVESGEYLSNGNPNREFDGMREVVISFEALLANLANLNLNNIFLQYRIQVDDEPWGDPVNMNIPFLTANTEIRPQNWRWFLYHITTGIEPGKMHQIQVRMVQVDQQGRRSYSIWTLPAQWLAVPDSEADDDERIEEDWRNHVRDELYRLLRRPYWVMRNDNQTFAAYLRPSLFGEMINAAQGRRIYLPFDQSNQTVYYIPASVFARLVQEEATFVLASDYVELAVPHRVLDLNNNPAVLTVADGIRRRDVSDMMVRLSINWQQGPTISGTPAITPTANINLHLVASNQALNIWEDALLEELLEMVDDFAQMERVLEALRREEPNIVVARHVLDIIDRAESEIIRIVANHFRTVPTRQPLAVNFDSAMLLQPRNVDEEAVVNAYRWQNAAWQRVQGTFANGRGIQVPSAGNFVFTGRQIIIEGLANVVGSGNTRGIVARHGLDDFLGGNNIDIAGTVTRAMLIDSIARMLGHSVNGGNASTFIREQGITIPPGNLTQPISTQEALSLVMAVYANRTNTEVSSIRITNFGLTSNLTGLNPQFTESFRAAIEIGIYRNYNLTPNAALTIGELLDILTQLDSLVGL